jgi:hypothetical protein
VPLSPYSSPLLTAEMAAQIYIRSVYHRYEPKGIFLVSGRRRHRSYETGGRGLPEQGLSGRQSVAPVVPETEIHRHQGYDHVVAQKMPPQLKLPLPKTDFIFEKITLTVPYQDNNYILYGDFKKFDAEHYQFNFESGEQGIQVALTVDVTLQKKRRVIEAIAMNADEFSADRPEMKIKRGNAWLNFHLEDGCMAADGRDWRRFDDLCRARFSWMPI